MSGRHVINVVYKTTTNCKVNNNLSSKQLTNVKYQHLHVKQDPQNLFLISQEMIL